MDLPVRIRLCHVILQHLVVPLHYHNVPFQYECISTIVSLQTQEGLILQLIILCPCPRVLGALNNFYLVKGPIDSSVVIFVFLPNTNMFIHYGYAVRIQGTDLYPPGENAPSRNSNNTPPPPSTPSAQSTSSTRSQNSNRASRMLRGQSSSSNRRRGQ